MNIKSQRIIITFLVFLLCATQIALPLTLYSNSKLQFLYKYLFNKNFEIVSKDDMNIVPNDEKDIKSFEDNRWSIEIPTIGLIAKIQDGIDFENLNQYVGHFTESGYTNGNICLAAHNRGYKVNYFKDIKSLQIGDEIIYKYKNLKLVYVVVNNRIIKDTDVKVVENTKENKITLITCVENEPSKRRCIEGKLKI